MRDFNRRLSWQRRWLNQQTNEPKPNERKSMNKKFDELTKALAQSVTRRGALKKFGVGLAGIALAALGLASRAEANSLRSRCSSDAQCQSDANPFSLCCGGRCADPRFDASNCGAC